VAAGGGVEMMPAAVEQRVRGLVATVLRRDVSALAASDDLVQHAGVDSLLGLQILAAVETTFAIRLPDDELIHLRSIERITSAVERAAAASAKASAVPPEPQRRRTPGGER
jgi:acyl carrier protein